ncbi:MAG: twin-arginine translocase TatA/TatE family subunit [Acidobacteria bacterium]|nr:MAG: twin-arginine translocase TatA/TatE family subunit [Acidobacteriota bacterium]
MFGTFGFQEMLLIFLLIVVFVGAKKLPQLGAGLGKGIKNFKKSLSEDDDKQIEPGNSDSE